MNRNLGEGEGNALTIELSIDALLRIEEDAPIVEEPLPSPSDEGSIEIIRAIGRDVWCSSCLGTKSTVLFVALHSPAPHQCTDARKG